MKLNRNLYLEYYLVEPFEYPIGYFYDFIHNIDSFVRFLNVYEVEGNLKSLEFIKWN